MSIVSLRPTAVDATYDGWLELSPAASKVAAVDPGADPVDDDYAGYIQSQTGPSPSTKQGFTLGTRPTFSTVDEVRAVGRFILSGTVSAAVTVSVFARMGGVDGAAVTFSTTDYPTWIDASVAVPRPGGGSWTPADVADTSLAMVVYVSNWNGDSVRAIYLTTFYCKVVGTEGPTFTVVIGLTADVTTNEIEAMYINETFDDTETGPPDNIVTPFGIVTEDYDRFFVLSQLAGEHGLCYVSDRRKPGIFKYRNAIRIGTGTEILRWITKTTGGNRYIGTSKDIYHLLGTADELGDGTLDLELVALNIGSPPADECLAVEGNSIIYRAADGMRTFDGVSSQPVPREAVELLHRGVDRYGVSALNLKNGRYRAALSGGRLTMLAPEGSHTNSSQALWRVDFNKGRWYRFVYLNVDISAAQFTAIHRERDGTIIAAEGVTGYGYVRRLDSGTADIDSSFNQLVTFYTTIDDDNDPLRKKDPFDLTLEMDTGNSTPSSIGIHQDGSETASVDFGTSSARCNGHSYFRARLNGITAGYKQLQLRVVGFFAGFRLWSTNVSYRARPQQRMYWDSGYISVGKEDVRWGRRVRLMLNTPANVTVTPYFDDVAGTSQTLTAVANKAKVYEVSLGRGQEGSAPRIVVTTTGSNNGTTTDPTGFELYWAEFDYFPSGNESQVKQHRTLPELA